MFGISAPWKAIVIRHFALIAILFVSLDVLSQTAVIGVSSDQASSATDQASATPRLRLTLDDVIQRAKANSPQFTAAATDARVAHEDRVQARAALLPNVSYTTGVIYTEPNGTPTGVFIAANAVREYTSQGLAKQVLSFANVADYRRARAAEALAKAKADVAVRGLIVTVVQDYYGVIVSQRKVANAQQAAAEAQRFLGLTQQLERGGEVAHSDVIKAQLQANDRQRDLQEATLGADKARYALAVLIFPNLTTDFELVDDLRFPPPLPSISELQQLAARNNPQLKAALAGLQVSQNEVSAAIGGHLPALTVNYLYGLDSTHYATRLDGIRNLGYQASATLDVPIFNWGATQSKVRQAELRRAQARIELTAAQRQAISDLRAFYSEAETAKAELDTLRQSADLAAESLRLTTLRYQAGEATALEIVDAQNTLTQARNNYDDGEVRYRTAIANLQTLTGSF
jgi:outer membrane protein TolC